MRKRNKKMERRDRWQNNLRQNTGEKFTSYDPILYEFQRVCDKFSKESEGYTYISHALYITQLKV